MPSRRSESKRQEITCKSSSLCTISKRASHMLSPSQCGLHTRINSIRAQHVYRPNSLRKSRPGIIASGRGSDQYLPRGRKAERAWPAHREAREADVPHHFFGRTHSWRIRILRKKKKNGNGNGACARAKAMSRNRDRRCTTLKTKS